MNVDGWKADCYNIFNFNETWTICTGSWIDQSYDKFSNPVVSDWVKDNKYIAKKRVKAAHTQW